MNRCFTLVEILVCIAILALLIGILFPVLSNSKQNAYKTTCASNLRAVGQAIRVYTDDNDGMWPSDKLWQFWNQTASPKLASCPLTVVPPEKQAEMDARGRVTGYAYNQGLSFWNTNVSTVDGELRLSEAPTHDRDILYPAVTVAFFDASFDRVFAYAPDPNAGVTPYPYDAQHGWERHNGGANYLFCDGHVKWFRANQVRPGYPQINDGTQPAFALQTREK
jgi:prepilin-type processing-associated H-X9-DG protein